MAKKQNVISFRTKPIKMEGNAPFLRMATNPLVTEPDKSGEMQNTIASDYSDTNVTANYDAFSAAGQVGDTAKACTIGAAFGVVGMFDSWETKGNSGGMWTFLETTAPKAKAQGSVNHPTKKDANGDPIKVTVPQVWLEGAYRSLTDAYISAWRAIAEDYFPKTKLHKIRLIDLVNLGSETLNRVHHRVVAKASEETAKKELEAKRGSNGKKVADQYDRAHRVFVSIRTFAKEDVKAVASDPHDWDDSTVLKVWKKVAANEKTFQNNKKKSK